VQSEFNFDFQTTFGSDDDALSHWRKQREQEQLSLAKSLGLPIGAEAEVWLKGGVRLRGRLELDEEMLLHASASTHNTKFLIGRTPFLYSEVESCVRL
jgi:hypothetical protein